VYVSDSKLEMLYQQIATPTAGKVALTLATPLGTAGLERDGSRSATRDKKVRAVEAALDANGLIGTVQEPKEYFRGHMSMRWGLFDDNGSRPESQPPLVYFGGFDSSIPLMVGLGGTSRHVLGMAGATNTHSRSYGHILTRWLMAGIEDIEPPSSARWWDAPVEDRTVLVAMAIALQRFGPPTQQLAFLAKTLTYGNAEGCEQYLGVERARAVLGTPIYVLDMDPRPEPDFWGLQDWQ
jgi:hypothetical protein